MAPTPCTHVDLVSHWHLAAPVGRVWEALATPDTWPRWWPQVRRVQMLQPGGHGGLGRVHRIEWATGLGHTIALEIEAVDVLRHQRLRGRAHGRLQGEGIWLLATEPGGTMVTCLWRVRLHQRWMRWTAPLLAPVFRWNHARVMHAGALGLARHLAEAPAQAAAR